jgi:hypothetical protein
LPTFVACDNITNIIDNPWDPANSCNAAIDNGLVFNITLPVNNYIYGIDDTIVFLAVYSQIQPDTLINMVASLYSRYYTPKICE